jgi:hypothetical protein
MEQLHAVKGLDPVADALSGTVYSDVVRMSNYNRVLFAVYVGVSTGGTAQSVFKVYACDDVSHTNKTAIPFYYREVLTGDTEATIPTRAVAADGFENTAGSSRLLLIEAKAEDLAATGYDFVVLEAVEGGAGKNDPVVAGILVLMGEPRDRKSIAATAIV